MSTILVALNDSASSRAVVDSFVKLELCSEQFDFKLVHVLIKPAAGDELMGKKFMKEQPVRIQKMLDQAKKSLVACGVSPSKIETEIVSEPCDTVADGIIEVFRKGDYRMVVVGRKKMSKAQEFVLGDPSVRLVRALEGTAILVVKSD